MVSPVPLAHKYQLARRVPLEMMVRKAPQGRPELPGHPEHRVRRVPQARQGLPELQAHRDRLDR